MDTENGLVDTVREEEGGMNLESSSDIHTLPRVRQLASGKLLCSRGSASCSATI